MTQKIIFTLLSHLVLYGCERVDDKSITQNEPSEELKVEIIKEEIIENPINDLKLTDENIIEFLYQYEKIIKRIKSEFILTLDKLKYYYMIIRPTIDQTSFS